MLPTKVNYIEDSFHKSVINYQQQYKSKHWRYYNNKKIKLLNKKFITDFRKNALHLNLDDKAQNIDSLLSFFNQILKKVGRNFVEQNLDTNNIGNNQHYFKYKSFFVDFNLLHAINFLYEIVTNIALNNNMIICEIGGGYGHLSKLLRKNFKSKILLNDLPETNCLSSYYLMENFGYDVRLAEYPYDNYWSVLSSKKSEFQPHIHQLITKRTAKNDPSISKELTSIENFTKKNKEFVLAGKKIGLLRSK